MKHSYTKAVYVALAVAFGLVALAVGFKGVQESSDIRSRASHTSTIYKQWEFNGATTEEWRRVGGGAGLKLQNGYLTFAIAALPPVQIIENLSVFTSLPSGLKSVSFSMKLSRPRITTDKFTGSVLYKLKGKTSYESPIQFDGLIDGKFKTYTINLPQSLAMSIDSMQIKIGTPLRIGDSGAFDWIRINGAVLQPTPPYYDPKPCATTPYLSAGAPSGYPTPYPTGYPTRYPTPSYYPTPCPSNYPSPSYYPTYYVTPTPACYTQCNILTNECTTICPTPTGRKYLGPPETSQ